jgi:hypothetical protein
MSHFAYAVEDFLRRSLAYRTGVKKNYVRTLRKIRHFISCGAQPRQSTLSIRHVHLATESFYIDARFHTALF